MNPTHALAGPAPSEWFMAGIFAALLRAVDFHHVVIDHPRAPDHFHVFFADRSSPTGCYPALSFERTPRMQAVLTKMLPGTQIDARRPEAFAA